MITLPSPLKPKHLILVCCHAIYLSGPSNGISEDEWLLASFQSGETPTFAAHIQAGLRLVSSEPSSLLIFSGSKTRSETQKSEAQSYLDLCFDNDFWGLLSGDGREEIMKRLVLEEQALDSFANLLFSILKFWRSTRTWPDKITIVSHEFKRARFMELHVKAARWPKDRVEFVGIDPKYMIEESEEWDAGRAESVRKGERERGFGAWESDLLGMGEVLKGKRGSRNHWRVNQLWFSSEDERRRSGVKMRVVSGDGREEEVLLDVEQPWETG
jgi:hypothetical protein